MIYTSFAEVLLIASSMILFYETKVIGLTDILHLRVEGLVGGAHPTKE